MKKTKIMFFLGIACVLALAAACWYSVTYNEARLVIPMDVSAYVFRSRDLPMLLAGGLVLAYGLALFVLLMRAILKNGRTQAVAKTTRKLDPRLGALGILGFLGFAGFWTYSVNGAIFPFLFFVFFGFFGFFFEGKMSGTYMDERYQENARRAQFTALKAGFAIQFFTLIVLGQGRLLGNLEHVAIALLAILSLTVALVLFLSEYLLYRYDHDEGEEE